MVEKAAYSSKRPAPTPPIRGADRFRLPGRTPHGPAGPIVLDPRSAPRFTEMPLATRVCGHSGPSVNAAPSGTNHLSARHPYLRNAVVSAISQTDAAGVYL